MWAEDNGRAKGMEVQLTVRTVSQLWNLGIDRPWRRQKHEGPW